MTANTKKTKARAPQSPPKRKKGSSKAGPSSEPRKARKKAGKAVSSDWNLWLKQVDAIQAGLGAREGRRKQLHELRWSELRRFLDAGQKRYNLRSLAFELQRRWRNGVPAARPYVQALDLDLEKIKPGRRRKARVDE